MCTIKEFFDSLSLSGGIIFLLFLIIIGGLVMVITGHTEGNDVWKTALTAFTTFIAGRKLTQSEQDDINIHNKVSQPKE